MARPKSNRPVKIPMNFTVTPDVKQMLNILAADAGCSASELVASWTEREFKSYRRRMGAAAQTVDVPGQMSLDL
ncbi:MAG: hypothetical protein LIO81_05450 [Clostridiales bacterium]|nr:hypothetical protein [Clostridiales bacterium]